MSWIGFVRATRLGFVNYWRNRWLSLAATLVVTLMLFTMSVFAVQSIVIYRTTQQLKQKIDIVVFFTDAATEPQIDALRQVLANRVDVSEVTYTSKEQAFGIFQSRTLPSTIKALVTPEHNPLPRYLTIRATDPANLPTISAVLANATYQPLIASKSNDDAAQQRLIQNLAETARLTRRNGVVLTGIFFLIAALMVFNTTQVVIHARGEEIEVMRLVGSTQWFIEWPFMVEGLLYGSLGAVVATALLAVFFQNDLLSATPLSSITGLLGGDMLTFFHDHLGTILGLQLVTGWLVSMSATLIALYRRVRQ